MLQKPKKTPFFLKNRDFQQISSKIPKNPEKSRKNPKNGPKTPILAIFSPNPSKIGPGPQKTAPDPPKTPRTPKTEKSALLTLPISLRKFAQKPPKIDFPGPRFPLCFEIKSEKSALFFPKFPDLPFPFTVAN